jgi:hypothetical protein
MPSHNVECVYTPQGGTATTCKRNDGRGFVISRESVDVF